MRPCNPGNSGGPLLDCQGGLLGIVSLKLTAAEGIGLAIPATHLIALEKEIGKQEIFHGEWSFGHPAFGLRMQHEKGTNWVGFDLGLGLVWADRWSVRSTLGMAWGISTSRESPLDTRSSTRGAIELTGGYRILLVARPTPLYLIPSVGGTVLFDSILRTRTTLQLTDKACLSGDQPCPIQATTSESKTKNTRWMPQVGLDFNVGGADFGYAFQLDTKDTKASNHRIFLGVAF